jgi:short-subunit dehydrogenase
MIVATTMRKVATATAAAAVSVATLACLDCNPTLYAADLWFRHRPRTRNSWQEGKCIWIVGASSGIGEELAYQIAAGSSSSTTPLSQQQELQQIEAAYTQLSSGMTGEISGVHLILSSRSVDKLELVAAKCRSLNDCRVTIVPLDVSCPDDLVRAVQTVSAVLTSTSSTLDTLVYNAGVGHLSPALETSAATAETVWRVNALGPMILIPLLFSHQLWPTTPNHDGRYRPHLVVTASVASIVPVPLSAAYTAAKHGLLGYLRTLRAERPDILLHTILPGPVDSDFHQHSNYPNNCNSSSLAKTHSVPPPESASTLGSPQRLCLTVPRCAQLIHSTMKLPYSAETWIAAPAVVLWGLYLQQYVVPASFLHACVYPALAARRLALWRAGADLYDPASWRRPPKRTHQLTPDQHDPPNK